MRGLLFGAPAENRTPDTLIKSQVLYQLSYRGIAITLKYDIINYVLCQYFFEKNFAKKLCEFNTEKSTAVHFMGHIFKYNVSVSDE